MANENVCVVAIVLSHNNVSDIERTILSLQKQTLCGDNLYTVAVDFGSVDGTYEKLLSFQRRNFGVYQHTESVGQEQYPLIGWQYARMSIQVYAIIIFF